MKIVVTGGGSGGHITPILAVSRELKQLQPNVQIDYIGQRGDGLTDIVERDSTIDHMYGVSAGKLRRYHGEGLKQLLDIKTLALNVRDIFRVLAGIVQSWRLLRRIRPDIIFIKGGYVGVPVGIAARMLHIPFITHDSDAIPGLANRIIGRWARKHAVALPKEVYAYPAAKTVTVGVPVAADYQFVTPTMRSQYRRDLSLSDDVMMLFIIGGGLGAQRINNAMVHIMPELLSRIPQLHIVHGVGRAHETTMQTAYAKILPKAAQNQVRVVGFLHDVFRYSGAADVVITRAGATNLAEFAVQGKACIVIPSPFLTGGHQLKNAQYLRDQNAAELVDEANMMKQPNVLLDTLVNLLNDADKQLELSSQFRSFGHPDAAHKLAQLLLDEGHNA